MDPDRGKETLDFIISACVLGLAYIFIDTAISWFKGSGDDEDL